MADFSKTELYNELAALLKVDVTTQRDGNVINTRSTYDQVLQLAAITFLVNPDAVFYVGQLAKNKLVGLLDLEISYLCLLYTSPSPRDCS